MRLLFFFFFLFFFLHKYDACRWSNIDDNGFDVRSCGIQRRVKRNSLCSIVGMDKNHAHCMELSFESMTWNNVTSSHDRAEITVTLSGVTSTRRVPIRRHLVLWICHYCMLMWRHMRLALTPLFCVKFDTSRIQYMTDISWCNHLTCKFTAVSV